MSEQPKWMADISEFSGWFRGKGQQVTPATIVAFGIPIQSRYSKAREVVEMLEFARLAAESGVAGYVSSVFYDSKSCCCTIEPNEEAKRQAIVLHTIYACADRTISMFTDDLGIVRGKGNSP
ncbi:MAG: hypothetical protein E6R10_07210 [Rhodocyclaceae bacterium]|nr:MAG: hypothetical protein E6R10_07210 [Rhodocyclaceae bacterium]